jgi:hypothetical protein
VTDEAKPTHCPECRSPRVARVIYGLYEIKGELEQALNEGVYVLGGCVVIEGESPRWACVECFHRWGPVQLPPSADGRRPSPTQRPSRRAPDPAARITLEELGLSTALRNCLECEGITTARDLSVHTAEELLEIRNFGQKRLRELREKLAAVGLKLRGE